LESVPIWGHFWGHFGSQKVRCPQMSLSDTEIRKAKPQAKPVRMFDGKGLYLEVSPAGGKLWRMKYRHDNKEKRLSLGVYPEVSLKVARDKGFTARQQLAEGIDPGIVRKAEKQAQGGGDSFEAIAREWVENFASSRTEGYNRQIIQRLEKDIFPWMGKRPISEIKAPELLAVLRRIESRGALESAHRQKQTCGLVFRYAVATGRMDRDPSGDLKGALPNRKERHHASITEPRRVGELLRAIDGYEGQFVTKCALRMMPLVFVRTGELRMAQWPEFDLDAAEWRIPAERMKMRVQHIVPLSQEVVQILRELEPLTNRGIYGKPDAPRYAFPGGHSREKPMSNNAILAALRRMGYSKDEMTGHGFRSMASTLLHEQGWNHQAIERQLAHAERNAVSAAYNYAEHLPERRRMMQAWAQYLDSLKANLNVVSLFRAMG
jgi:integrase